MFDHILAKFKGTTALTFKVIGEGATTQPRPAVEGVEAVIPYNTPVTLPQPYYDVVVGAGYTVELLATEEDADAAGADEAEQEDTETKAEGEAGSAAEEAPDETLGGGSAASAGGSEDRSGAPVTDPAPAFDADAVIAGNVEDVVARLGDLTDEQLTLVKDAEVDREKPRVGVTGAIDETIAARAAAKQGEGA